MPDGGRVVVVSSAVADVVAFLCSDAGRWMTGAVLDATGACAERPDPRVSTVGRAAPLWWDGAMAGQESARRRETGAASARSLLLTVLGEFVLPRDTPVWTSTLVSALAEVDVEEKAARQALSRTAGEGLLVSERDGRRVRWSLSPSGTQLLRQGSERIYGFGEASKPWDERWLVLAVSVPETQRQLRHRLRTRLTWAGLGSPLPGLWVSPDAGKESEVAAVVRELGVEAFSFTGPFGEVGNEQQVVRQAWALDDVEARYRDFLGSTERERAELPHEQFAAQVRLVQEWRRFPFLDPALPPELLAPSWPGPPAAALFRDRHAAWHEGAQAHWDELCSTSGTRT